MDINGLKGRIAEAFVEAILRRAGYHVCRIGRESEPQRLLRSGQGEFLPDFLVWKPLEGAHRAQPVHRLLSVEVKYRRHLNEYLHGERMLRLVGAARQWPQLYVVLVTDNPGEGRSCFQVLDLSCGAPTATPTTADLHEVQTLEVYRRTAEEYETLVKQVFALLNAQPRDEDQPRKPEVRVPARPFTPYGAVAPRDAPGAEAG